VPDGNNSMSPRTQRRQRRQFAAKRLIDILNRATASIYAHPHRGGRIILFTDLLNFTYFLCSGAAASMVPGKASRPMGRALIRGQSQPLAQPSP
jgi:hypothetical protein